MNWGFDFDGVLAAGPAPNDKKWGVMNGEERRARKAHLLAHYAVAAKIHDPVTWTFHVITARKADPAVRRVSERWLTQNFAVGRVLGLHMLEVSRSVPAVIEFKAGIIQCLGITDFVEDNVKIVNGLRRLLPACRVWLFADGQCVAPNNA